MVAPVAPSFTDPSCPLSPELRSDLAYRRARGRTWDDLGQALGCNPDALRRAAENDPEFAAAAKRARKDAWHEGQADGLRRLRAQANGSDEDQALRASKILVQYAAEREERETRLKIERIRAKTRLAVEELRASARAAKAAAGEGEVWVEPIRPAPETEEERQKRFAHEHAERAARPEAEVYIWGGKHSLGRCIGPDESDIRVRIRPDWSCGLGERGTVYWVVPDPIPPEAWMPGDPPLTPTAP
jgi:hypothetical protein